MIRHFLLWLWLVAISLAPALFVCTLDTALLVCILDSAAAQVYCEAVSVLWRARALCKEKSACVVYRNFQISVPTKEERERMRILDS